MSDVFSLLSTLILLSSFILMANKRTRSHIRTFRLQSILIALAAGIMGVKSLREDGRIDVLVICAVIVLLKVIYIPGLLNKTYERVEYKVEKDFIFNIPILVMLSCGLVVFSYLFISSIDIVISGTPSIQVANSISLVLIGLFFMITRKKAIGQIIGFLVIENGLFLTAMFATEGMPFIVDMGIFIDMITAVMIMGLMVFRINEKFETTNLDKLKNLKG